MPKIHTFTRGGSRFYVHPEDRKKQVPGVTSIIDMVPKDFLKFWAAKMAGEFAVDNLGAVVDLAVAGERQAAIDLVKNAHVRNKDKAAARGTDVHDAFEKLASGEDIKPKEVKPNIRPYLPHFKEFFQLAQPEVLYMEEAVWSDEHGYAGSFDLIAKINDGRGNRPTAMVDYKTSRSGVYPEVSLQATAYSKADFILKPSGETIEIPEIEAGAVFHVRPEGWALHPVAISDEVFEFFLALKKVREWVKDYSDGVLGNPIEWEDE